MTDKRRPWLQFYTRDWRSNPKLRMCSFGARGLWIDMISLMAEAVPFGFLLVKDVAPTCKQLAGLLGGSEKEIAKLRAELGEANVYSVTGEDMPDDVKALIPANMPEGVIFSRKMVRDKAKAEKHSANGKLGGNPTLRGPDNGGDNPPRGPGKGVVNHPIDHDGKLDKGGVNPRLKAQSQSPESKNHGSSVGTDAAREAQRAGSARLARSAAEIAERMKMLAHKKRMAS